MSMIVTMERHIFPVYLLCLGVGCLTVTIPEEKYEFACGENITLPCSFESTQKNSSVAIIAWSVGEKELPILVYYYPVGVTDIKMRYQNRVTLDVDLAEGKANLNLTSITPQDNEVYKCRVLIPGDKDDGTPADTTRLVVQECE